jgi:hypothetical protein
MIWTILYKTWPVVCTTALYMFQCGLYVRDHNYGLAVAFAGYAAANVGLIWASL